MRHLLGSLLAIGLTAAPASASPGMGLAVALRGPSALTEIAPAPRTATSVRLTLRELPAADSLPSLRFTEQRTAPEQDEMPWIWQVLRTKVYSQMPQRETGGISFVMAPVVVVGQYDTIPGIGVAGDF